MRVLTVLSVLVTYWGTIAGARASAEDQFRPLFNGKDLSGWVLVNTPPQTWSVQEGMLVCSGKPIGEIRTDRMYQNFVLEVEWRHMVPKGNAGIFVWADDITARGVPFHRSIEVQVLENAYGQSAGHTTHGDIFPIHGATMTPFNGRVGSRAFPTEERSKPSPEWNHYRIECRDGSISLAVNGKVVTQGKDASPRKGYLCLESEGGVVHYRNLKIQELPETPVAPEHVAVANRGYRSIYNGLDLSNWMIPEAGVSHWNANDWILSYDGQAPTPNDAILQSAESLDNCGFIVDVRPRDGFRNLSLCGESIQLTSDALKSGNWSRLEGSIVSGKLRLTLNDKQLSDAEVKTGVKLTLHPTGPVDFANLYIRDIKP